MFDHWWHECWERQAFARVHRIGQTKEVHTAKLVAAGSMDEHIMAMQTRKKEAIGSAVGGGTAQQKHDEIYDMICEESADGEELGLTRSKNTSDHDEESNTESEGESTSESDTSDDGQRWGF